MVGLGKMGERMARALTVFDFKVNGWAAARELQGVECFSGMDRPGRFVRDAHSWSACCRCDDETRDIINRPHAGACCSPGSM